MVVSADELKNRREVRADDFRPRGPAARNPATPASPTSPPAATTAEPSSESLDERRARRGKDPEDVLTLRAQREPKRTAPEATWDDGPVYVTAPGARGDEAHAAGARQAQAGNQIAAAGVSVAAVLVTPIELSGGSATVVARVERTSGALRGARFIGSASATAGRVTVRFSAAYLADGRKARVDGEAQDGDGSFGLRVENPATERDDDRGSVLGDVAGATASDLVSESVGAGIAGRAVDRAFASSRAHRPGQAARTVTVPAGTRLQIFLHEPLEVRE